MYPHERSLVETYQDQPFAIIGVNSDPTAAFLREVMAEKDLNWTSFFDGGGTGGPIATKWGVRAWPTVFVLDHEGVIRHKGRNDLDTLIEELVAEASAAR